MFLLALLLGRLSTTAAVLHVDSRQKQTPADGTAWSTAFPDLHQALAIAIAGDEVWVAAGTYGPAELSHGIPPRRPFDIPSGVAVFGGFAGHETSRNQRAPTANRSILTGWNGGNGYPDESTLEPLVRFAPEADPRSRLDGFRLEFNRANYAAAVLITGGSPVIANNTIVSNTVTGPVGGSAVLVDRIAQLQPLEPLDFFERVAGRMLAANGLTGSDGRPVSLTNIMVWPTNDYSGEAFRVLQVAANLYDASGLTNHQAGGEPAYPTVFRPLLRREAGTDFWGDRIYVADFQLQDVHGHVTDPAGFVNGTNFWNLSEAGVRAQVPLSADATARQPLALGVPLVIGARKGLPNFNELAVETSLNIQRIVQVLRSARYSLPYVTNEFYVLGITNAFGLEAWNSYLAAYPRPLELAVEVGFDMAILSTNGFIQWPQVFFPPSQSVSTNFSGRMSFPAGGWAGHQFQVPIWTNHLFLTNSVHTPRSYPRFRPVTTNVFSGNLATPNEFHIPDWNLVITNRIRYVLTDAGRIIDFVNIDRLIWATNIIETVARDNVRYGNTPQSLPWLMNRQNGAQNFKAPTEGLINQLMISAGFLGTTETTWRNYAGQPITGRDKDLAIDNFRQFLLSPYTQYFPGSGNPVSPNGLVAIAPFYANRRLQLERRYQVSDPLVHHLAEHLELPANGGDVVALPPGTAHVIGSNLDATLGKVNSRYTPWPGESLPKSQPRDPWAQDFSRQDPWITSSDRWRFPDSGRLHHGWLDEIHRGTPWATIHYGSANQTLTNDWRWIAEFRRDWLGLPVVESPAPEPVIVNNTIAFNAVTPPLPGTAVQLEPGTLTAMINNIVAFNAAGIGQHPTGQPWILNNAVFANTNGNYLGVSPGWLDRNLDPQFQNAARGDYTLSTTSPLIDAGHALPPRAHWLSRDEPARWQNDRFDIGAAELSMDVPPRLKIRPSADYTVEITVQGFPGLRYELQTSPRLESWSWTAGEIVTTTAGQATVHQPASSDAGFYRAQRVAD